MVRLKRGAPPALLVEKQREWTERAARRRQEGHASDWATEAARNLLRGELMKLAHGKCAFCESLLGVSTHCEIEHYDARAVKPERTFDWANLLPSCRLCNGEKSSQDHAGALIKPDEEDPEPLFAVRPDGSLEPSVNASDEQRRRALETIRICDLNRGELCSERERLLADIGRWIKRCEQGVGQMERDERDCFLQPAHRYKLVLRLQWTELGLGELAELDRVRFFE